MEKIFSIDQNRYIEIRRLSDEIYVLRKFEKRWDYEEGVEYWVRVRPNPSGRYADVSTALKEAEEIMAQR